VSVFFSSIGFSSVTVGGLLAASFCISTVLELHPTNPKINNQPVIIDSIFLIISPPY